jgi:hypothetical protein
MSVFAGVVIGSVSAADAPGLLPRPLDSYVLPAQASLGTVLRSRAEAEPLNVVALAIFLLAIVHTLLAARIRRWVRVFEQRHAAETGRRGEAGFAGQALHFFGEIEVVFGIWAVVLAGAITWFRGWGAAVDYISDRVSYTEPLFVAVTMALAATRPVLALAERCLSSVAGLGRGTPGAWWLAILVLAPLLGSLITEPAAMTIAALLLARQFYDLKPGPPLAYATLGLLFVNVSVGGLLTHFAAPPVIMVAHAWNWDSRHMLVSFGWRAVAGIVVSSGLYYAIFRREFAALAGRAAGLKAEARREPAPAWITVVHVGFLVFTVWQEDHPVMFVGGFLFFLAFAQATARHQGQVDLRSPLLVGFFLAGLVIHGGLQAWWIEPILTRLGEAHVFLGATVLTAFNDNAAITFLASHVPGFSDPLKYALVAGAVAGGGLTVIANAPNPAGQAILSRHFSDGVAPLRLLAAALVPTGIMALCFMGL